MSALKPYPHYEINVKDNSIYNFSIEEILPVHRPLWILRTQEGPAGEPIWCSGATALAKKFGGQTLNLANPKYASRQTFFLNQIMQSNGAFIVRALDDSAKYATAILEAVVTEDHPVVQYMVDEDDPLSLTFGKRVKDTDLDSDTYGEYLPKTELNVEYDLTTDTTFVSGKTYYVVDAYGTYTVFILANEPSVSYALTTDDTFVAGKEYYTKAGDVYTVDSTVVTGNAVTSNTYHEKTVVIGVGSAVTSNTYYEKTETTVLVTEPGLKIMYRVRPALPAEFDPSSTPMINNLDKLEPAPGTDNTTVYPILAITATNPGEYGNDLAFRFFNLLSENNAQTIASRGSVFNSFSSVRREYNTSNSNIIFDTYGSNYNTFAADPDCVDPETGIQYNMDAIITNAFDVDNPVGTDFPFTVYTYENMLNAIGEKIIAVEKDSNNDNLAYDELDLESADDMSGFQINVLGGKNILGDTYNHVVIDNKSVGSVNLHPSIDIYLTGGTDGNLQENPIADKKTKSWDRDNFIDQYTYNFLKLYINPKIVDKFKYPITHIHDPGFSITTKFAMIDFLDIRDDVGIKLATQVLFPNDWATGKKGFIALNDQATDIANGLVLRERALLMRESILRGTDCMRAAIYPQAGTPVSAVYSEPVPFTLWSAVKQAAVGNTAQMGIDEPRGLPGAYNLLFKNWNWINYNENMKEKTWDAGLNYCQYADTTRIFYPALRTVYRAATSSLVDEYVVDSLIYTKHECRKAWAKFSGRNDNQAILEGYIKHYLETNLAFLYNGKYAFEVTVYRTEEDNKLGYVERVKLKLTYPGTMRVMVFDIEVNREGYDPESEA